MKPAILDEIVTRRGETLRARFSADRVRALEIKAAAAEKPRDFHAALSGEPAWGIIAEIKARSPSKGILLRDPDPAAWSALYASAGASAISIVTEENYFNGNLEWIGIAKRACPRPVLRKDFLTVHEDLLESRAAGADAVLLIAAILDDETLPRLVDGALSFGLEPVVEVHSIEEAERAVRTRARVVGINNRNLRDFSVSLDVTRAILPLLKNRLVISESGIASRKEIEEFSAKGVKAFLVGETFLTSPDPKSAVEKLVARPKGAGLR